MTTRLVCRSEIGEEERRERASLSSKNDSNSFEFKATTMARVGPGVVLEFR